MITTILIIPTDKSKPNLRRKNAADNFKRLDLAALFRPTCLVKSKHQSDDEQELLVGHRASICKNPNASVSEFCYKRSIML